VLVIPNFGENPSLSFNPKEEKYYKGYPMGNATNPDHLPAVNVKAQSWGKTDGFGGNLCSDSNFFRSFRFRE